MTQISEFSPRMKNKWNGPNNGNGAVVLSAPGFHPANGGGLKTCNNNAEIINVNYYAAFLATDRGNWHTVLVPAPRPFKSNISD